jgi:hypothetical protein
MGRNARHFGYDPSFEEFNTIILIQDSFLDQLVIFFHRKAPDWVGGRLVNIAGELSRNGHDRFPLRSQTFLPCIVPTAVSLSNEFTE